MWVWKRGKGLAWALAEDVQKGGFQQETSQLSPQTAPHVYELLRCFPSVMGVMGVGVGEEP